MATGKTVASLLSTPSNAIPSYRLKVTSPSRCQWREVLRQGQHNPWARRREHRVRHHVAADRLDERDPRVLAAGLAVGGRCS